MSKSFSAFWHDDLEKAVKKACADHDGPFPMSLTGKSAITAVIRAVNQGIDAHLEACNVPERGDRYAHGKRSFTATEDSAHWKKGDEAVITTSLDCVVSMESLPVLIRRLMEDSTEDESGEGAFALASDICGCLDIDLV